MLEGTTGETWHNLATGLGGLLTGVAATFGVLAAYFRFRRSHEARVNVSMDLVTRWTAIAGSRILIVSVNVKNDGGRHIVMVSNNPQAPSMSSRISIDALTSPNAVSGTKPARIVRWGSQGGTGSRLFREDQELAAGDSWHYEYAFQVLRSVELANVVVELQVREGTLERRGSKVTSRMFTNTVSHP